MCAWCNRPSGHRRTRRKDSFLTLNGAENVDLVWLRAVAKLSLPTVEFEYALNTAQLTNNSPIEKELMALAALNKLRQSAAQLYVTGRSTGKDAPLRLVPCAANGHAATHAGVEGGVSPREGREAFAEEGR